MSHGASTTPSTLPLGALSNPPGAKCAWHSSIGLAARRTLLLHILMLLKTKYGRVDAKISYIARRAELALYSQAFSAWEYRNPQTLSRRLHSLVVKLHLNNLAGREDEAFAVEDAQMRAIFSAREGVQDASFRDGCFGSGAEKRSGDSLSLPGTAPKRRRVDYAGLAGSDGPRSVQVQVSSRLFFYGNDDLVQQVCTFLDARDILRCSATCSSANRILPSLVTTIQVSTNALSVLTLANRALFFGKFPNLERFALHGSMAHPTQFDFQNETTLLSRNVVCRSLVAALSRASLPKLTHFGLNSAYTEGLHDRITSQVASALFAPENSGGIRSRSTSRFPRLQQLSLCGNGISDDGVMYLCDALTASSMHDGDDSGTAAAMELRELALEQNYIGERGHLQLEDAVEFFASRGRAIAIRVKDNLLAVLPSSSSP